ncbi:HAD family hydrolase [Bremerella sp. JC817]|uniref:HAD family hydrolase n=1 Tax=Bremerella sp. JC817 TaxID=3231756 RepID=UPI00345B499F
MTYTSTGSPGSIGGATRSYMGSDDGMKTLATLLLLLIPSLVLAEDPLPSWNEGPAKQSIIDFVEKVTDKNSDTYVPIYDRVAVFDNDGTLWCEAPLPMQVYYVLAALKEKVAQDPTLAEKPMVKAALAGDFEKLLQGTHYDGLVEIIGLTHAGMTTTEYDAAVKAWVKTFRHPRFDRSLAGMTYQPMQELLRYLRANDFQTFIVSGGGADFMRVFAYRIYGIPTNQIVGTNTLTKFELVDGKPVLMKTMDHMFVDDKAGKPVGIHQFIGRRPIAAFGNSDGDQQMLEYTTIDNPYPSFGLLVHHTDAKRAYAYDSHPPSSGKLVTALEAAPKYGWTVVSMKDDWKTIFFGSE